MGQEKDSTVATKTINDTTFTKKKFVADSISTNNKFNMHIKTQLRRPTMPRLRISEKQKKFSVDVSSDDFVDPAEATNWDALNMPTTRTDYEIRTDYFPPLVPIPPIVSPQKDSQKLLSIHEYIMPTRQELDILEILWLKENVMDTTIYSCLDMTLNTTMEDLNHLLNEMIRKNMVSRKQVSPRHEFNAFGILIEMSPQNRKNKVYSYHSNIDRELMKRFIDANAYLFKEDSSIVNRKQLEAARRDTALLRDLNTKIHLPK